MTQSSNRDAWRKFLGIGNPSSQLNDARNGGLVPRTAGKSGGGSGGAGGIQGDIPPPDGGDEESAEKGDGGADLSKRLKPGDKFDRFEDLYDCETGEEVTIDGLGKDGSQKFPTGFADCKKTNNCDDMPPSTLVWVIKNTAGTQSFYSFTPNGACYAAGGIEFISSDNSCLLPAEGGNFYRPVGQTTLSSLTQSERNELCGGGWPAVDKNHLNFNKESGCFEPLCPDLNNQVLDKYQGCNDELILCDKDGNKVKVKADGNQVAVTQAKFNQTAYVRNGKVETVKKLTESQTENEFK